MSDPFVHEANEEEKWYWFYAFVTVAVITVVLTGVIIALIAVARRRGASTMLSTVNPCSRRASRVTAVDSREVGTDVVENDAFGNATRVTTGNRRRPGSLVRYAGFRRLGENNAESVVAEEGFKAATSGDNEVESEVKTRGFIRGVINKTPKLLTTAKTSPADKDGSAIELSQRVRNGLASDVTVTTISDNSISAGRELSDTVVDRFKTEKFAAASTFEGRHPFRRDTPPPPPLSQRGKAAIDRVFLAVGEGGGGGRGGPASSAGRRVAPSDGVSRMTRSRPASVGSAPIVGDVVSRGVEARGL